MQNQSLNIDLSKILQNQSLNIDLSTNSSQENLIQKGDYMTVNVLGLII